MHEFRDGWIQREVNGAVWLEYDGVRVTEGRRGPLDKVSIACNPGDLMVYPKVGQALAMIGAMIAIQQRSFTNTPIEHRLLGIDGWVREVAEVGPDIELAGKLAAEVDRIWHRARGQ